MERETPASHFHPVKTPKLEPEFKRLRELMHNMVMEQIDELISMDEAMIDDPALEFLESWEREIWGTLFVLCRQFCPSRETELVDAAKFHVQRKLSRLFQVDISPKAVLEARANIKISRALLNDIRDLIISKGASNHLGRRFMQTVLLITEIMKLPRWQGYEDNVGRKFEAKDTNQVFSNVIRPWGCEPTGITYQHEDTCQRKTYRCYDLADVELAIRKMEKL
jgi:hypothetical protein